jgi:4a-hydroxytetrahydrobiopterin dehydratase
MDTRLTETQINERRAAIRSEWVVGPRSITRKFSCPDFVASMAFVNRIAEIAEQDQHHPDIKISYNVVEIELTTHAIGGLTEKDFLLAGKIDTIHHKVDAKLDSN